MASLSLLSDTTYKARTRKHSWPCAASLRKPFKASRRHRLGGYAPTATRFPCQLQAGISCAAYFPSQATALSTTSQQLSPLSDWQPIASYINCATLGDSVVVAYRWYHIVCPHNRPANAIIHVVDVWVPGDSASVYGFIKYLLCAPHMRFDRFRHHHACVRPVSCYSCRHIYDSRPVTSWFLRHPSSSVQPPPHVFATTGLKQCALLPSLSSPVATVPAREPYKSVSVEHFFWYLNKAAAPTKSPSNQPIRKVGSFHDWSVTMKSFFKRLKFSCFNIAHFRH